MQTSLRAELERLMAELTPGQRQVLTLRFGLEDGQPLPLAKVGASLGISRERVGQIEQQALCKLARHRADINKFLAS